MLEVNEMQKKAAVEAGTTDENKDFEKEARHMFSLMDKNVDGEVTKDESRVVFQQMHGLTNDLPPEERETTKAKTKVLLEEIDNWKNFKAEPQGDGEGDGDGDEEEFSEEGGDGDEEGGGDEEGPWR